MLDLIILLTSWTLAAAYSPPSVCLFPPQTLTHKSPCSELLNWSFVKMAFIWFPLPTSNKMEPQQVHGAIEGEPGSKARSTASDKKCEESEFELQRFSSSCVLDVLITIWTFAIIVPAFRKWMRTSLSYITLEKKNTVRHPRPRVTSSSCCSLLPSVEENVWCEGDFSPRLRLCLSVLSSPPSLPWRHST